MALTVNHAKTNNIADWTQAELDQQIARGNYPAGTVLADIVSPSDWNANLNVTGSIEWGEITGTLSDQTDLQTVLDGKQPLDADLTAISALASTGFAVKSATTPTWVQRSLNGTANEITVTNGGGVGGSPVFSLPSALTFTGKTVTGGTFNSPAINTPAGITTSDVTEGSNLYHTSERVDDRVAALIQNGTGISWTYDDTANTLTGNVSITQYTDELAQDAVGNVVGNGLDYDDASGAISVDETELAHNSIGSKQGGTTNEYYHLTAAQNTLVAALDADLATFSLPASTTISTFGASLVDDAAASDARTTLGLGTIATEAETNYLLAAGTRGLSADWDAGSFEIRAQTFESDVATGTAPLVVASTTKVTNLNADLLDDQSGAYYLDSANFTGTNWTDLTDAGATTLHKHDHGGMDGLSDDDHTQYLLRQPTADVVINDSGGDFNFRVEGDTDQNLLFLDAGTDAFMVGTSTAAASAKATFELGTSNLTAQGDRFDLFGIVFLNRDQTAATRNLFSFKFADTSANIVDGARFIGGKEQEWTSTVSTRKAYIGFQSRDGASLVERWRGDSQGNWMISPDGSFTSPTSARGALVLFNGTAPTGSATNGIVLYSEDVSSSAELKVRDEAGNVTTLSPHNFSKIPGGPSEDMAWAHYSERDGKFVNVDMLKLARLVEKLTGEKIVYEGVK